MPYEREPNTFLSPTHEGGGKREKPKKTQVEDPSKSAESFDREGGRSTEEAKVDEELLQNSEKVLRDFVGAPATKAKKSWQNLLREHLRARLEGTQDRYYFDAMKNWVHRWEPEERNRIVSGAFIYELEHRRTMGDQKYFNPAIVFGLALDAAGNEGSAARTLDTYLDRIPLYEMEQVLFRRGTKRKTEDEEKDTLRLARVALRREETDPEKAQKIIERGEQIMLRRIQGWIGKYEYNRAKNGIADARRYGDTSRFSEPRDRALFDRVLQQLATNKDHLFVPDLMEAITEQSPAGISLSDAGERLYASSPTVRALSLERKILTQAQRREQEQKQEEERARVRVEKEKQEQRERQEDRSFFREHLSNTSVDASHLSLERGMLWRVSGEPSWALPRIEDPRDWHVFVFPSSERKPMSYGDFWRTVDHLDRYAETDEAERGELYAEYEKVRATIEQQLTTLIGEKSGEIFQALLPKAPDMKTASTQELETYLSDLERIVTKLETERERHTNSSFKNDLLQNLHNRFTAYRQPWDALLKERMRHDEEEENTKEKIRKEIKGKIEYLRKLYSKGTGLRLPALSGNVLEIEGQHIGSVSLGGGGGGGGGMGMGFELRQKMQLLDPNDGIFLEVGTDVQAMERRKGMTDWITPHEIAHLVDQKVKFITERFFQETVLAPELLDELQRKGVQVQLEHDLKECVIDGLGFRMLREYGTSDPEATSVGERMTAAIHGFSIAKEVFYGIIDRADLHAQESYTIVALRMIAVGEQLRNKATEEHADTTVIDSTLQELNRRFTTLNEETGLHITEKSQQEILRLCGEFFKKAETIQFKKS